MTQQIRQPVPDEDAALAALLAEAEALAGRVREAFRARFDLEQAPTYETGEPLPRENPAYDGSKRSFYLNWANTTAGQLVHYLREASSGSIEQTRHWYAKPDPSHSGGDGAGS